MRRAGAYRINYAVESGSPRVQQMIRKTWIWNAPDRSSLYGEEGYFHRWILHAGFRDETEEGSLDDDQLRIKHKAAYGQFFLLTPFPTRPCTRRPWH